VAARDRQSAAKTAFDNAKNEVAILSDGTKSLDDIMKLRAERVENVKLLIRNNVLANSMLVQAQSHLSDVRERKQTALSAVALVKAATCLRRTGHRTAAREGVAGQQRCA